MANEKSTGTTDCSSKVGVEHPNDVDVLLGRGKKLQNHLGNIRHRDLVLKNKVCYTTATKECKMKISKSIVCAIYVQNGRFLKQDNKTKMWMDVGEKIAIRKTSQALREQQAKIRDALAGLVKTGTSADSVKQEESFNCPKTFFDDAIGNTSDPIADQCRSLTTSGGSCATSRGSSTLHRQSGFRISPIYGTNEAMNDEEMFSEPEVDLASTLDIGAIRLNSDEDPLLESSPPASPLDASRKIFDKQDSTASSSSSSSDNEDEYDIETTPRCEKPSRKLSVLIRMSGLTEDLAMSQRKFLLLQGISKCSLMSGLSDMPADNDDDDGFVRRQPTKYDSLASNDSMPTVKSVQSTRSMFSRMSVISTPQFDVSGNDGDDLVTACCTETMSSLGMDNIGVGQPKKYDMLSNRGSISLSTISLLSMVSH